MTADLRCPACGAPCDPETGECSFWASVWAYVRPQLEAVVSSINVSGPAASFADFWGDVRRRSA